MTDLSLSPPAGTTSSQRLSRSALLYAGVGLAAAAGLLLGRSAGGAPPGMEWQLTLLLRFMAAAKAALVLGALALTQWRLRREASPRLALGYGAALAAMALAPGLIWSLAAIAPGAACFHGGLLAFLVLAWRDEAVAPRRSASPR